MAPASACRTGRWGTRGRPPDAGAGAVVPQTLTVMIDAVAGGELAANEVVRTALTASERVHLLGMVSDGGVHSGSSTCAP